MAQARLTGGSALVKQGPKMNRAPAVLSVSIVSVHTDPRVVGVPKQAPDQQTSEPHVVDGQVVVAASGQRAQQVGRSREGDVVVAATLIKADGKPGTWRFEAQPGESIEAGSLRVLQGDVALLTPTAVVFRLKGVAGERVSFTYRLRR